MRTLPTGAGARRGVTSPSDNLCGTFSARNTYSRTLAQRPGVNHQRTRKSADIKVRSKPPMLGGKNVLSVYDNLPPVRRRRTIGLYYNLHVVRGDRVTL